MGSRRAPQDLLGQAELLEAFLSQQQHKGRAAAARTAWLVHQQALEQEAADCAAQLRASCSACPAAATALSAGIEAGVHSGSSFGGGAHGSSSSSTQLAAALVAADGCVGEAAALASAVAGLVSGPTRDITALAAMQRQLQSLNLRLREALAAVDAAARAALLPGADSPLQPGSARSSVAGSIGSAALDSRSKMSKAVGTSNASISASIAEQLGSLFSTHPLAAESCQAQLLEHAAGLEARQAQQRQQRRAALRAFLANTCTERQQQQETACSGGALSSRLGGTGPGHALTPSLQPSPSAACGSSGSTDSDDGEQVESEHSTGEAAALAEAASGSPDGWTADEQAVFLHARRTCMAPGSSGGGGGSEAALVRQLAALLPSRSQQEVAAHERWYKEAARLQAAVQQGEAGWRQERAAFLDAAAALLAESEAHALVGSEAALAQLEAAEASLRSASGVEQGQAAREEASTADSLARAVAAAAAAAQRLEQWQAREDYRTRLHQLVSEHRERREEQAAAASAAERAAAAAAAQEAAAAAAANRQRVTLRRQRDEAKQADRRQAEVCRKAEKERRAAALDALRRQVAPEVGRDAQRATGPTLSSTACADKPAHGLFVGAVLGGFSSDQILRDQRVKVYEALRQLGLHTSAAGRQALAATRGPRPLRPDTLTSAQRQGLA